MQQKPSLGTIETPIRSNFMNDNEPHEKPHLFEPLDLILGVGGAAAALTVLWLSFA